MRLTALLLGLVCVACGVARIVAPDGTVAECRAFGQAHAVACVHGYAHDSTTAAFVLGDCCDVHGGALSPQTDTMMASIISAIVSAAVTIAAHGGF